MKPEKLYSYGQKRTDFYQLAARLKTLKEWRMGHMRAEFNKGVATVGLLPVKYQNGSKSVFASEYIVYSYATPIAWVVNGEWVQPEVKYSATTTKHQGRIAVAVSVLDETPEHGPQEKPNKEEKEKGKGQNKEEVKTTTPNTDNDKSKGKNNANKR